MGFPTANLELRSEMASELRPGVYAASVAWDDREPRAAVVNLGCRPTFRERGLTFEVHVLDFDGDLYGKDLGVTLVARIRDEKRFDGQEALVEQIGRDVEKARDWFADNGVHQ